MASLMNTTNRRGRRRITPIQRPEALSDIMLTRLRADIVSGAFAFGERLSEDKLSRLYGVTKAPVRSALLKLQAEGLLKIVPQRGAFVMDPSLEEVRALCELRIALELEAARLALQRNPSELAERISEIVAKMEPLSQRVNNWVYQSLDMELHLAFFRAARSDMLEATYLSAVNSRFAALRQRLAENKRLAARSFLEHRKILDAIYAKNRRELSELLRQHIEFIIDYFSEEKISSDDPREQARAGLLLREEVLDEGLDL
jgi:DNA-binding GntR family transcriptional regulator